MTPNQFLKINQLLEQSESRHLADALIVVPDETMEDLAKKIAFLENDNASEDYIQKFAESYIVEALENRQPENNITIPYQLLDHE